MHQILNMLLTMPIGFFAIVMGQSIEFPIGFAGVITSRGNYVITSRNNFVEAKQY